MKFKIFEYIVGDPIIIKHNILSMYTITIFTFFQSILSPNDIIKTPEIIKSITQEDIKATLKNFMNLNKTSIVVAHPELKKNSPSFKGKLIKEGLNLKEFNQTKLPNNINV